jgi:hypothetical protein
MGIEQQYPEITQFLDTSDTYVNTGTEFKQGGDRFLLVTQKGVDGQQLLFKWNGSQFDFQTNETIIDSQKLFGPALAPAAATTCGASSKADHDTVFRAMLEQVNVFNSSSGPDHGNLACCWTVRHIVLNALNRAITQTDGTAEFGDELKRCFHQGSDEAQVLHGGIIISPTQNTPHGRNIGHVGLLGEGTGDARLVYSNSSADAKFEQNFTVGKWKARYKDTKHLDVLFYPLPIRPALTS